MNVFESHFENLKGKKEQLQNSGQVVPSDLEDEINRCQADRIRLNDNVQKFQRLRACQFFSIDYERFFKNNSENEEAQSHLEEKARKLFQTLATQAFQLGYVMAIFTVVEELIDEQPNSHRFLYKDRFKLVEFITHTYLSALNTYFSPKESTLHRTLTGYISESRASAFEVTAQGLRGLLAMSVNEINERQWRFFRYAILEIVHSRFCWNTTVEKMRKMDNEQAVEWYNAAIPRLVSSIISEREKYINDAVEASVKGREFELLKMNRESEARGAGRSPKQIQQLIDELQTTRKAEAKKRAYDHLKASLKPVQSKKEMVRRLRSVMVK